MQKPHTGLPLYSQEARMPAPQAILDFIERFERTREAYKSTPYNKTNVVNLPVIPNNFSDPADKARHDRMVQLVEQMLALHKQLAEARTGHDTTMIQRQIDATDRQLDRLVYELYGLTEEEISVVEGKLSL